MCIKSLEDFSKFSQQNIESSTASSIVSPSSSPLLMSMPERFASPSIINGRKRLEDKEASLNAPLYVKRGASNKGRAR